MNWVSITSGKSLSAVRHQAISGTNANLLSIGLVRTNLSEIRFKIYSFSFKEMHLKVSSAEMAAILSTGRLVKTPIGTIQSLWGAEMYAMYRLKTF